MRFDTNKQHLDHQDSQPDALFRMTSNVQVNVV